MSVTVGSLTVARVYYTHAIGVASSFPPVPTMTSTVAFMGAKPPNRAGITRNGLTMPEMFTPPIPGPSTMPSPGGSMGATSVLLLSDP